MIYAKKLKITVVIVSNNVYIKYAIFEKNNVNM